MALLKNMTTALLLSCIAGCASPDPPAPQSVERAREVQKTVDDHADATREAIENQERGDTPR